MSEELYHFTTADAVDTILEEGLLPGDEADNRRTYTDDGREMQGDGGYVYLWNEEAARYWCGRIRDGGGPWRREETVLLAVDVPEECGLERDYDMLLYGMDDADTERWREEHVEPFFENYGVEFTGSVTVANVKEHVDAIDEEVWEEEVGAYRSQDAFEPATITVRALDTFADDE